MSLPKDGGAAFPVSDTVYANGQVQYGSNGMTLRDWFAGQALSGLLAYHNAERGDFHTNATTLVAAAFAYNLADQMIVAREQKEEA